VEERHNSGVFAYQRAATNWLQKRSSDAGSWMHPALFLRHKLRAVLFVSKTAVCDMYPIPVLNNFRYCCAFSVISSFVLAFCLIEKSDAPNASATNTSSFLLPVVGSPLSHK